MLTEQPTEQSTAKKTYRFIGTFQELSDVGLLNEFGQKVELTDEQYKAHEDKAQILPEAEFDSLGFTEEELTAHSNPNDHQYFDSNSRQTVKGAPDEFLAKKQKGLALMQQRQTEKE